MKHISNDELNRFIDNELSEQEKESIEKHLNECTLCFDELKSFSALQSLLLENHDEKAPEGIETTIMKKIVRRIKNEKSQRTFFGFVISLFSTGILFIVGFVTYNFWNSMLPLKIDNEIVQRFDKTFGLVKSFTQALFGHRRAVSFEVSLLLFFILSIYFIIEKYKTIRS